MKTNMNPHPIFTSVFGLVVFLACSQSVFCQQRTNAKIAQSENRKSVRIAAAQPKNRTIDWKLDDPAEVLRRIDKSLAELEQIVRKAGEARCDALALPEDTLGLLK